VRKKQGGSQSSHDSKASSSRPKSAGASIRRYNETRFRQQVLELVQSWKTFLDESAVILIFAPGNNNISTLFCCGSPLDKKDTRVLTIPLTLRRPSLVEVKRVHETLSSVEFFTVVKIPEIPNTKAEDSVNAESSSHIGESEEEKMNKKKRKKKKKKKKIEEGKGLTESRGPTTDSSESEEDLLLKAVREQNLEELKRLNSEEYISPLPLNADQFNTPLSLSIFLLTPCDFESQNWGSEIETENANEDSDSDNNVESNAMLNKRVEIVKYLVSVAKGKKEELDAKIPSWQYRTALHKASHEGMATLVSMLLCAGANPTLTPDNLDSKTPYDLAKDKPTRDAFRKFAGSNPDLWDWGQAHVPMLTTHMEKQIQKKKIEKLKRKRRERKEKTKTAKLVEEEKMQELKIREEEEEQQIELGIIADDQQRRLDSMSEREKRAHAAEVRRIAHSPKPSELCDFCKKPLTMVPFYRYEFKYCSISCVHQHREILEK